MTRTTQTQRATLEHAERLLLAAAPQAPAPAGLVTAAAFDRLLALANSQAARILELVQSTGAAEVALRKVLAAVQRYMPPDGPSAKETLAAIIEIVDPWPLNAPT